MSIDVNRIWNKKITKKPLILCLKMLFLACQKDKCPNGTRLAFFDRLFLVENQCFLWVSTNFKNPPIEKGGFNQYFSLKKWEEYLIGNA